jgi:hypothetical protein
VAVVRSRRVRDTRMGGLVQQPAAPGAHRQHPAGRSRETLLRYAVNRILVRILPGVPVLTSAPLSQKEKGRRRSVGRIRASKNLLGPDRWLGSLIDPRMRLSVPDETAMAA